MGRKFSNVSEEMKIVPYKVVEGPNGDVRVQVKDGQFFAAGDLDQNPAEAQARR